MAERKKRSAFLMQEIESKIIRDALLKWNDLPSRTIARKLIADNPDVWLKSKLENVRTSIRYLRGKQGANNLAKAVRSNKFVEKSEPSHFIPPSDESDFIPHIVKNELSRDAKIAVLGDIHLPYHSVKALRNVFARLDKLKPDLIILNGDTIDFYKLSRFMKDPRCRSVKKEIETTNDFLDALDERYPKAKKIWKDGNHEERLDHYVMSAAPEIYDLKMVTLTELLQLNERRFDYVNDKRAIYLGNLTVLHGHEYPTPMIGPVNAARGLFLRTKASSLVNHHHQVSEHVENDVRGKSIATWSLGCLCDLHPMYSRYNRWSHGYAQVTLSPSGEFVVSNIKV